MNASLTDSDQYTVSTNLAADHDAYHVGIDAGPYRIAYADIRPTRASVELSIDVATGEPLAPSTSPPHRRSVRPRRQRTPRTLLATLPLGDVDLLDGVAQHCASVHTRSAGCSCLVDGRLLG